MEMHFSFAKLRARAALKIEFILGVFRTLVSKAEKIFIQRAFQVGAEREMFFEFMIFSNGFFAWLQIELIHRDSTMKIRSFSAATVSLPQSRDR